MKFIQNKSKTYFYSLITLILLTFVASLVVSQSNSNISLAQIKQDKIKEREIKIFNKVSNFRLVKIKTVGKEVHILLKNECGKSINSFYATVGSGEDGNTYNVEFLYSGIKNEISPNEVFTFKISLEEKLYTEGLTLQAVIFADKTEEGEYSILQEMKDIRLGEKTQLIKGLDLLKTHLALLKNNSSLLVENLGVNISSFETKDDTRSSAYNSGLSSGKANLIYYLDNIKNNENKSSLYVEQELMKLQSKLEGVISKL